MGLWASEGPGRQARRPGSAGARAGGGPAAAARRSPGFSGMAFAARPLSCSAAPSCAVAPLLALERSRGGAGRQGGGGSREGPLHSSKVAGGAGCCRQAGAAGASAEAPPWHVVAGLLAQAALLLRQVSLQVGAAGLRDRALQRQCLRSALHRPAVLRGAPGRAGGGARAGTRPPCPLLPQAAPRRAAHQATKKAAAARSGLPAKDYRPPPPPPLPWPPSPGRPQRRRAARPTLQLPGRSTGAQENSCCSLRSKSLSRRSRAAMAASPAAMAANAEQVPQAPCSLTGDTKLQQPAASGARRGG
jgi:hypothetical protein